MSGSTQRRWQGSSIVGTGLACLAAGCISVSGCTTPLTADLNAAAKKDEQVAKSSGKSAAKKAFPKVAVKEPPGKARVSDLDDTPDSQMVAQKTPPKSDASKRSASQTPASQARRQETQLASAAVDVQAPATSRSGVSRADSNAIAAKQLKSAQARSSATRAASEVAAGTLPGSGSIKQTAGDGQSPSMAKQRTEPTRPARQQSKRPAVQQQNLGPQAAEPEITLTSSHERRRADRLMDRAHERYRSGYPEEALRLASVAFELEKSRQAVYRAGEERPSDYITWLQSMAATRNSNPPMIRPQAGVNQWPPNAREARSSISAAVAETSGQRRVGEVIRANAGSNAPGAVDVAVNPAVGTRSNTGVDLAAPEAPRFTSVDQPNLRSGANAGQVEVPVSPTPRSAAASIAMTNADGPSLDPPALPEANRPVVIGGDHVSEKAVRTARSQTPALDKSKETPATAVVATDDAPTENDAFAESETPALIPARTTQLTIASLVGLVTGIAGMFGLSWWRHQEQRHYAAGK